MSHTDDVINQWRPPATLARVEWSDRDNDRAVGFEDGGEIGVGRVSDIQQDVEGVDRTGVV